MPIKKSSIGTILDVNENSTCRLIFQVTDYDETPITTVNSASFTLTDRRTGDIINARDGVNVLSYIDGNGNFDFLLLPDDNAVQSNTNDVLGDIPEEVHIATFVITAASNGDTLQLTEEIWLRIVNLEQT